MSNQINVIKGIVAGQYGSPIRLVIVDSDGDPIDISSYTTGKTVFLREPFANKTVSFIATYVTNGVDGELQFTPTSGDLDRPGKWEGQIKLATASAAVYTAVFEFNVDKKIATT
jgi:hypothetical protein